MLVLPNPHGHFHRLAYSPDSKLLATGGGRAMSMKGPAGVVRVWDVTTGTPLKQFDHSHTFGVMAVGFSPKGKWLASASGCKDSGSVRLFDLRAMSGTSLGGWSYETYALTFSPSGRTLAFGGGGVVQVWDVGAKQVKKTLGLHSKPEPGEQRFSSVHSLAYSPTGRILAAAVNVWISSTPSSGRSRNRHAYEVQLWDPARGRLRATLLGHTKSVRSVAYSPDGRLLASASEDKTIRLWDVAAAEVRDTLHHDPDGKGAGALAFTPDGSAILSVGADGKVVVWDVTTMQPRVAYDWRVGPLSDLAVAPDGSTAAVAGKTGIVIWDLG